MTEFAVVENGCIVNVILWDGVSEFETPHTMIPLPEGAAVGAELIDGQWVNPEPIEIEGHADALAEANEQLGRREAALAKLVALGLTEAEAAALIGG